MQLREPAATYHCPPHPLIHVGREEIPRLSDSHLLMQCEAAVEIAVQLCDLEYCTNLCRDRDTHRRGTLMVLVLKISPQGSNLL